MVLDRFNLAPVVGDYWKSLRVYGTNKADWSSRAVLILVPLSAGSAVVALQWRIASPTTVLPAAALLAGALFAACGQLISLRARIADSVVLSGNVRVKAIYREAISGVVIAAVTALVDALLLAVLAAIPAMNTSNLALPVPAVQRWSAVVLSAIVAALTTLVVLMFIAAARKLYMAYLEAFEEGLSLDSASTKATGDSRADGPEEQDVAEAKSAEILRRHGLGSRGEA